MESIWEQIISIKDLQFDKNTNKYLYKIPEKKIKNPSSFIHHANPAINNAGIMNLEFLFNQLL